ncbi:phosphoglucosamine mutase [Spirulina sp. CS-785/01]|uniref:phosphoglucosamine mutase n=1 Tax=Spirulina sp. CS-785/01 TaxID=3021716 RepID=UPI00232B8EDE|nr:phosphoglucosamine mutase [Spirulina sp. CS-785/01]MDB9313259.1 phosphoglucosamine mutase [Spirulina sp. CS-785/01]
MVSSPVQVQHNSVTSPVTSPKSHQPNGSQLFKTITPLPESRLFGTDGIRGQAGKLLNASLALSIGFWAGQVLRNATDAAQPIILGQDSRNSSDMLATALSAGLTSAGLEVWNMGLCPTPCVSYVTNQTNAMGGIMISASHNPPEDNGIKFFNGDGTKLSATLTQQIEAALRGQYHAPVLYQGWGHHYYRPELVGQYTNFLQNSLLTHQNFQGLKVVLDLAWGASVHVAPAVFRAMGAKVVCLHEQPDGDRINVGCGSTHLNLLQRAVQEHQADLGFAFDGDADRVMAVDAQGRIIDGDYILYFWGKQLKDRQLLPNNLIIATVMANLGFERAWQQLGGQLTRTTVGDQYVQAEMFQTGAMLGGEQSGHILCHHHSFSGDGLQTALHLTTLVRQMGHSLADLVNDSFTPYPQLLRNVPVEDYQRRTQWQDCEKLQLAIAQAEKQLGEQGRVLVRASGTEPLIRVMVESACPDSAAHWTQQLVQIVAEHLGS